VLTAFKPDPIFCYPQTQLSERPTTSLSTIDINLLQVWFAALCVGDPIAYVGRVNTNDASPGTDNSMTLSFFCTILSSLNHLPFSSSMKQQDGTILIQLHSPCSTVFARVHSSSLIPDNLRGWLNECIYELLAFVRTARAAFQKRSKLLRASFQLFLLVQRITVSLGHKSDKTLPESMCRSLRGRLGSSPIYLCTMVK
jgi:hypothetical protein